MPWIPQPHRCDPDKQKDKNKIRYKYYPCSMYKHETSLRVNIAADIVVYRSILILFSKYLENLLCIWKFMRIVVNNAVMLPPCFFDLKTHNIFSLAINQISRNFLLSRINGAWSNTMPLSRRSVNLVMPTGKTGQTILRRFFVRWNSGSTSWLVVYTSSWDFPSRLLRLESPNLGLCVES